MYLGTCKVQKKVLYLLELELNAVISCLTWELEVKLWKNSTCSQLLSHLSRTKIFIRVILLVHAYVIQSIGNIVFYFNFFPLQQLH